MGRYGSTAVAAPHGAPGSLDWGLLVGGTGGMVIMLLLSTALYRAFCRSGSPSLETGSFFVGLTGDAGVVVTLVGAGLVIERAPSGPPADTRACLSLLAAAVGVGAVLVVAFVLSRTASPPPKPFPGNLHPVAEPTIALAAVAALVVAVLAAVGAVGVLHVSLVKLLAWAYLGTGLGIIAVSALVGIAWIVAGIADA